MSNIQGPGGADKAQRLDRVRNVRRAQRASSASSPVPARAPDRADISAEARLLAQIRDLPPAREDRVEAVRQMIQDEKFDLDGAFRQAMQKLLDEEFGV